MDSLGVLKHLAAEDHKVSSRNELQFWRRQVKYLAPGLSAGGRSILEDRETVILQAPEPQIKEQMMSFLGLTNYCHSWVSNYAETTAPPPLPKKKKKVKYEEDLEMISSEVDWRSRNSIWSNKTSVSIKCCFSKEWIQMVETDPFRTSLLAQQHGSKLKPAA